MKTLSSSVSNYPASVCVRVCSVGSDSLLPSMRFPRQEYWSGLPFSSPGDLPDPGIERTSLVSLALAAGPLRLLGRPISLPRGNYYF